MTEKLTIKKNEIQNLIENEIKQYKPQLEDMGGGLGDDTDRKIDYTKKPEESGVKTKFKLKEPIPELLEYLSKLGEARGILTKCAAAHKNEEVQKKLYSHYEKNNKLALEMIRDFGIIEH